MALLRDTLVVRSLEIVITLHDELPGGEYLAYFLLGMCPLDSQSPYPIYSLFCGQVIDAILVTFGQIHNFRHPNLVTFYLCIYPILNEEHFAFHPHYKHFGTFSDRKYEELSYPQIKKGSTPF